MIPLRDNVSHRSLPVVTLVLIALNMVVYLYEVSLGAAGAATTEPGAAEAFVLEFGATPCRLSGACAALDDFPGPVVTLFTSMFMHSLNPIHVVGNMLYLWIFGDNVEDTLGHGRLLFIYQGAGVAAALGHVMLGPSSRVPMVGASGAISGVLGAYLLLFPYARILTLLIIGFFIRFVHVPALIVLGFWFVVQALNGFMFFRAQSLGRGESGGVAWFAHIGGFVAGMLLLFLLRPRQNSRL